jgi:hypothetical protein
MTFSCARIKHTIRIDTSAKTYFCCAMQDTPKFADYEELLASEWYESIIALQDKGVWPSECSQCKDQEDHGQTSFRIASNRKHQIFSKIDADYKVLDVSTDNICNAACQTCDYGSSSFYGKMLGRKKLVRNGGEKQVDRYLNEKVLQIDLAGGEPFYSKSYLKILDDLPSNVRWLRINTNGSVYRDISDILDRGIIVELTVSLDAIGRPFEYIRWPLKWDIANENFDRWLAIRDKYPTRLKLSVNYTVSALNIAIIDEMRDWTKARNVGLFYNYLKFKDVLDIRYSNRLTKRAINVKYDFPIAWDRDNDKELEKWLVKNDQLRKLDYRDYLGEI